MPVPSDFLFAARFTESDFRSVAWADRGNVWDAPELSPRFPGFRQGGLDPSDAAGRGHWLSPHGPQYFMPPQSGVAPNGLPIFNWDQAAVQLARDSNGWAGVGNPAVVTFGFRETAPGTMPGGATNFSQFSAAQIAATLEVLSLWSDVANITFVRVGDGYTNDATILFANYNTPGDGASAFAFYPGSTAASSFAGDVWVNLAVPENSVLTEGTFGPHILAHEIGHAIGLAHPGDYDASDPGDPTYPGSADYWQDARMFTVMSYFGSAGTGGSLNAFASGPQLHDIAAAQYLYGANMTTRTGDTIYGFNSNAGHERYLITADGQSPVFAIWDAGGNDTIDFSGYSTPVEIDLREEAFSSAGPGNGGAGVAIGNIAIARGAVIENGIGGSGNDVLIGNAVANTLNGGAGDDTLTGNGADNRLDGQGGADTLDGGAGSDAVLGGDGADTIYASAGNDSLQGQNGNDTFIWTSTDGRDTFNGGADTDTVNLTGSAVADVADTNWNGSVITGLLNNALVDIESVNLDLGAGGAGGDWLRYNTAIGVTVNLELGIATGFASITGVENLIGGTGNDELVGDAGVNKINGNAGDDFISGGGGGDNLTGGLGQDVFIYQAGAGADTINDFDAWDVGGQDFINVQTLGINAGNFASRVTIIDTGADTVVRIDSDIFITLKNVSGDGDNVITMADFILGP